MGNTEMMHTLKTKIITPVREWMFRMWYRYVHYLDRNAEILFMNYGYHCPTLRVKLDPEDEPNRFAAQLYHVLASEVNLRDKEILEIGSGRGGGLSYLAKTFSPARALGVDLARAATRFCNKHYRQKGLSFAQGDAQNLSFLPDNSFDAILNVESSHRYPHMHLFLKEVYRLLRPNGFFLYTDFRDDQKFPELKRQLSESGLLTLREDVITPNVVKALEADDARKRRLVRKLAPFGVRHIAMKFAATSGTGTFNKFLNNQFGYYRFVLQKPGI